MQRPRPRIAAVLVLGIGIACFLLLTACSKGGSGGAETTTDSPGKAITELASDLQKTNLDAAISRVDDQSKDRYSAFFTSIGPSGMTDYGVMLSSLTLSAKTDTTADFVGVWIFGDQTLPVKATFRKDRTGSWKFLILE